MRPFAMKKTLLSAAAVVALSALPAAAATQTGNLNVTTTIQVSCQAPSPSGTLRLPFESDNALDSQWVSSTLVTVTITCYGNPTVNHVTFDNGTHRSNVASAEDEVRYMLRSGAQSPTAEDYLGYKLYATDSPHATAGDMGSAQDLIDTTATGNANRLTFSEDYNGTFKVNGRIFESTSRTGAFGDPTDAASGGAVPGGTYNDTVVMTVDYN
ncbi:hypothetical protein DZK27_14825 [Rhodobacteraceae bacterium 63075]|nr:hypothetical protein DZK27_14825 [Rhodobacteraceae bacterium 63075]